MNDEFDFAKFSLPISPKIFNAIALAYTNPYRVLMEYIVNSIDAAILFYYNDSQEEYSKEVIITVKVNGKNIKDAEIVFDDNCRGFKSVAVNTIFDNYMIGDSNKSDETNTVGKFGVGLMTFVGICKKLNIIEKEKGMPFTMESAMDSSLFNQPGLNYVPITNSVIDYKGDINDSFTRVVLSNFKAEKFKEFDFTEFKEEIELHLDQILRRKNLIIKLINNRGHEFICKPFDFDAIEGEPYEKNITELKYMRYKKGKKESTMSINPDAVKIFLKVTKNKIFEGRRPFFVNKGVRIDRISKFDEFRTNQKGFIWSHPNVTGYIDITGVVEPSITRDSFEPNEKLKPLFYTLSKLEPEIKLYIESQMKTLNGHNTNKLELKLNDALREFLKKEKQKLNSPNTIKNSAIEAEIKKIFLFGQKEGIYLRTDTGKTRTTEAEENKQRKKKEKLKNSLREIEITFPKEKEVLSDNENTHSENLFNLKIDNINEPDKDEFNTPYRSKFTGAEVIIFQKHPSFQSKVESTSYLQKITSSLITYLATEIVMHYQINFSDATDHEALGQKTFSDFITSVYEFERYLKDLNGKNITDLSENGI